MKDYTTFYRDTTNSNFFKSSSGTIINDEGSYYYIELYSLNDLDRGSKIHSIWINNCANIGQCYHQFTSSIVQMETPAKFCIYKKSYLGLTNYGGVDAVEQENKLNKKLLLL